MKVHLFCLLNQREALMYVYYVTEGTLYLKAALCEVNKQQVKKKRYCWIFPRLLAQLWWRASLTVAIIKLNGRLEGSRVSYCGPV